MVERRLTGMIAAAVALIFLLVVWDAFKPTRRPILPPEPAVVVPPPSAPVARSSSQGTAPSALDPPLTNEPNYMEAMARSDARRRIRASAGSTYLNEMLAATGDSMLRRWDNRETPVRVWFAPTYTANFQPAFLDAIRAALGSWTAAGVPLRFEFTEDSANAHVVFRWKPQFEIERTGQTDLSWDGEGRIQSALVTLATFDPKGRALHVDDVRVVAEHEIGHVLGLDHSPDSTDLMFATAKVRALSDRDVRTVLLLYQLTPGSIR